MLAKTLNRLSEIFLVLFLFLVLFSLDVNISMFKIMILGCDKWILNQKFKFKELIY